MKFAGIIAEYDPSTTATHGSWRRRGRWGRSGWAVAMSCGLPSGERCAVAGGGAGAGGACLRSRPRVCPARALRLRGAEAFARAGVRILAAAGCDALVFGAENPDNRPTAKSCPGCCAAKHTAPALKQQLAAGHAALAARPAGGGAALCPGSDVARTAGQAQQ